MNDTGSHRFVLEYHLHFAQKGFSQRHFFLTRRNQESATKANTPLFQRIDTFLSELVSLFLCVLSTSSVPPWRVKKLQLTGIHCSERNMECWIAGLLDCWLWERFNLVESNRTGFFAGIFFAGLNQMYGGSCVMNCRVSGIDGGISGQGHAVELSRGGWEYVGSNRHPRFSRLGQGQSMVH